MEKVFLRSISLGCLLFILNFGKAQPVITEYFVMKEPIKIDITDKKNQKSMAVKGILDITLDNVDSIMAVTYDPKIVESKDVVKTVQEIFGVNNVGKISSIGHTK